MRILMDHLNNQIRPKPRISLALARRQFHIREPVFPVPEFRGNQLLKQRMLRPASHRNIAPVRQRYHPQRIFKALLGHHVSGNHRQRPHIQLRRIQRQHDRYRIVGTRIGIDDYFLWRSGSSGQAGMCAGSREAQQCANRARARCGPPSFLFDRRIQHCFPASIEGEEPKYETDLAQRAATVVFYHSRLPTPGAESEARLSRCPRSVKIKLRLREYFPQGCHIRIRCRVKFNTYLRCTYMCR